jgi:hypothetical protein
MTAEWVLAIFAGITLLILWTTTVIGAAIWLMRQLKTLKEEILGELDRKHLANAQNTKALEELVMRHDLILEPEFNGSGRSSYMNKRRQQ